MGGIYVDVTDKVIAQEQVVGIYFHETLLPFE